MEGKNTREELQSEGAEDVDKKDEEESSEKQETRERWVTKNIIKKNPEPELKEFVNFSDFVVVCLLYDHI